MLNDVTIQGRLVRDPELRHTPDDVAVTSFAVAVERDWKAEGGERIADYFEVVCWRGLAAFVCRYFRKGQMIVVNGRLKNKDYTDREGIKRTRAEIEAEKVYFCGPAPEAPGESNENEDGGLPS